MKNWNEEKRLLKLKEDEIVMNLFWLLIKPILIYLFSVLEKTNKNSYSKIDYNGIENSKMKAAKCLFETIISVLGNTIRDHLSINANFYEIGGNSLNCIQTITNLRERGYFIGNNLLIANILLSKFQILERVTIIYNVKF